MPGKVLGIMFALVAFVSFGSTSCAQQSHRLMVLGSSLQHARLGVMIEDVTAQKQKDDKLSVSSGALVTEVEDGSPADDAGIEEGDVIVKFGDRQIDNSDDLTRAVRKAKANTDVNIEIVRKSEHKTVTATMKRDRSMENFSFHMTPPAMPKIPRMNFNWRSFSESEYSGMEVEELSRQLADYFEAPNHHGLLVTEVHSGSDADKAGIKAGDVIVKVNDASVRDLSDFREELSDSKKNEASVELLRKGKTVTVKLHVESDDEDDDASIGTLGSLSCPDPSSSSIRERIFSKEFLHDLMESIRDIKTHLYNKVQDATQQIKMAFVKMKVGKTETPCLRQL